MSRDDEGFLARWSRRKVQARNVPGEPSAAPAAPPAAAPAPSPAAVPGAAPPQAAELPSLESLTPHSDFAAFMRPGVDPSLKGEALKTLFSDPSLYPMDGLDVYIDDYTKPDPLPEGWLERLNQFATLHGEPAPEATREEGETSAAAAEAPSPPAALAAPEHSQPLEASNTSDTSDTSQPAPESKNRGTT